MNTKLIAHNVQPQNEFMSRTSRTLLERNSQFMQATELPSLLNPMWYLNVMKVIRQRHGETPAFVGLPDLIRRHYGENAFELYTAVLQLKNAIRQLEAAQ